MKNFFKNYGYLIAAVIILFLGLRGCYTEKGYKKAFNDANALLIHQALETVHWKDDAGKAHATNKTLIVDKLIMEQENAHLAQQLKIKPKQIKGATSYITRTEIVKQFDTSYVDNWIEIYKDKDSIRISMTDTFQYVQYWKKSWFLSRKRYYIDISNSNPYVKVDKIKSLEVGKKDPNFILGLSTTYDPFSNRLVGGITLMYFPATIRF